MKNNPYRIAMQQLRFDASFAENMTQRMLARRMRGRRTLAILIAAAALLLAACAAIYFSTVSKLKRDAAAQASKTKAELHQEAELLAEAYVDAATPIVALDGEAQVGDVTLRMKTMEVYPDENGTREISLAFAFESSTTGAIILFDWLDEDIAGQRTLDAFDSFCEIGMDARDFVLTIGGASYAPYIKPDHEGQPQPAGWNGGDGCISMGFHGVDAAVGASTALMLSGTLHRYDRTGARTGTIGSFSIPFVYAYTDADRQERIDALTEQYVFGLQQSAAAREEKLSGLPEAATPIQQSMGEITLLDVAAKDDGLLLGLRYDLPVDTIFAEQMLTCYMDGYRIDGSVVDSQWEPQPSGDAAPSLTPARTPTTLTKLVHLPYYAGRDMLPETVTIACYRADGMAGGTHSLPDMYPFPSVLFVFRYDLRTGEVSLPHDDAERRAWFTLPEDNVCRVYDIAGQTQTVNGVPVTILRIEAYSNGNWAVCYKVNNVASEVMAWETLPEITVDGRAVKLLTEATVFRDEKIQEFLEHYSMEKVRGINDGWALRPPARIELLPAAFTVEIAWELYDLTKAGEREYIGAYAFSIPIDRDAYTVTDEAKYGRYFISEGGF